MNKYRVYFEATLDGKPQGEAYSFSSADKAQAISSARQTMGHLQGVGVITAFSAKVFSTEDARTERGDFLAEIPSDMKRVGRLDTASVRREL